MIRPGKQQTSEQSEISKVITLQNSDAFTQKSLRGYHADPKDAMDRRVE